MTLSPIHAKMGLSFAQGVTGFFNSRIEASLSAKLQKYRNQMSELTGAMNARAITFNEIATRDAGIRAMFAISQASAQNKGAAEVAAAAAGVSGRNVDSTMRGLRRSALLAQAARKMTIRSEMRKHHMDRVNNRVATILNRDITVVQKPSVLMAGLGVAANVFNVWENDRTPSEKAGLGGSSSISKNFVDWWQ